ncbi:NAD(P)-dependent oxidoreductase, partial [Staphylococcus aureus]|uniref:NAD(P)-dependent oxidoreductase n=1 Tax=Staphylococcus aureus TaxID=1280 RepID=UPI0016692D83
MKERVGFIGLGIMGYPMAENLNRAGYPLTVHNRTRQKAQQFASKTASKLASSPKEVAQQSTIIITMLPDSPDVQQVVAGEGGVLEGIREGSLLIDMSTISPVVTKK